MDSSHRSNFSSESAHPGKLRAAKEKKRNFTEEKSFLNRNGPEMIPPDGGWGWLVLFGSFISYVCSMFPSYGFSILFAPLLSGRVSSSKIAMIMGSHGFVRGVATILIGPLCEEFGWRKVAIAGGILNFISIFMSVFITNPEFLIFSFGILSGIACCIGKTLALIVPSRYFSRRRGFALSISSLGSSFASFVCPITANYLLDIFLFRGAALIYGTLLLNQCVAGALFQPVEWHEKPLSSLKSNFASKNDAKFAQINQDEVDSKEIIPLKKIPISKMSSTTIQNGITIAEFSHSSGSFLVSNTVTTVIKKSILKRKEKFKLSKNLYTILKRVTASTYESILTLKSMRVIIISIETTCMVLGQNNFYMWIPFVIRSAGYSLETSAWCVSISSITDTMARILISLLSDQNWFSVNYGYMFGTFLTGISIIAFSIVNEVKLFVICICCWGFGVGLCGSLRSNVYITMMGMEMFPSVLAVSNIFSAVAVISISPVVGLIQDETSSYTYAISFIGILELIGFATRLLMPLAKKYDEN